MDPLRYYNFKNSLELQETLGGSHYNFRAVFNGGFISGIYSYDFNAIIEPIFRAQLTVRKKRNYRCIKNRSRKIKRTGRRNRKIKEMGRRRGRKIKETGRFKIRKRRDYELRTYRCGTGP